MGRREAGGGGDGRGGGGGARATRDGRDAALILGPQVSALRSEPGTFLGLSLSRVITSTPVPGTEFLALPGVRDWSLITGRGGATKREGGGT